MPHCFTISIGYNAHDTPPTVATPCRTCCDLRTRYLTIPHLVGLKTATDNGIATKSFPQANEDPLKTFQPSIVSTMERYLFLKWTAWIKVQVIGDTPKWRDRTLHSESDWK